jgi:hypothetical protein
MHLIPKIPEMPQMSGMPQMPLISDSTVGDTSQKIALLFSYSQLLNEEYNCVQ